MQMKFPIAQNTDLQLNTRLYGGYLSKNLPNDSPFVISI